MKVCKNQKRSVLALLAGTSLMLSSSGLTYAQNPPGVPTSPLSPNDPAARLDPSLVNVPAMRMPEQGLAPTPPDTTPVSPIEINLENRAVTVGTLRRPSPNSASDAKYSPGRAGADAKTTPEPKGGGGQPVNGIKPPSVIGRDDRIKITATTTYPWRAMTKLIMTFPNGARATCSGALINAKYVLTAGHCIHDPSLGGWARSVEVIPGLAGTYKPYGSAYATRIRSYTGWTISRSPNYDIALLTLNRSVGITTGTLGYGSFPSINGVEANIAGYPGDRDNGLFLYYHYGPITSSTSQRAHYRIDTAGGQSGSCVYRFYNGGRYCMVVHTNGGSTSNSGTRIDSQKFNDIRSWINSGI